jgi:hypothetical protein
VWGKRNRMWTTLGDWDPEAAAAGGNVVCVVLCEGVEPGLAVVHRHVPAGRTVVVSASGGQPSPSAQWPMVYRGGGTEIEERLREWCEERKALAHETTQTLRGKAQSQLEFELRWSAARARLSGTWVHIVDPTKRRREDDALQGLWRNARHYFTDMFVVTSYLGLRPRWYGADRVFLHLGWARRQPSLLRCALRRLLDDEVAGPVLALLRRPDCWAETTPERRAEIRAALHHRLLPDLVSVVLTYQPRHDWLVVDLRPRPASASRSHDLYRYSL